MSEWRVKKGNTSIQDILVKDRDDADVANLASATAIKFQVKPRRTNSVIIEKTKGAGIEVDTPTTAYLRITLKPSDTANIPKKYVMAIEITWSADVKYEARIYIDDNETYDFVIEQDTIQ